MSKVKCVYLIKRVTSTWNGCDGCTSETDYLNWVFGARDRAEKKCAFFNKEYGGKRSPGCRIDFEVEKQTID